MPLSTPPALRALYKLPVVIINEVPLRSLPLRVLVLPRVLSGMDAQVILDWHRIFWFGTVFIAISFCRKKHKTHWVWIEWKLNEKETQPRTVVQDCCRKYFYIHRLFFENLRIKKEIINVYSQNAIVIIIVILSILVYTFFSRMFDLMLPPVAKHSIVVA